MSWPASLAEDELHIFAHGIRLMASIGIEPAEHLAPQPVVIDVDLIVRADPPLTTENIADTVSYADVVAAAHRIVEAGHIELVETLAERLAAAVRTDDRVRRCRVRVAKPEIFAEADAVGVTIERG